MNKLSSLRKVTGLSPKEIAGLKVKNSMSIAGEKTPHRRSIVVEKDRFMQGADTEEAFEIIVDKIAKVTDNNRVEVENALIVTGSPKGVRGMNRKRLNAEIQNRLVENSPNGMAFRQYMTALVGGMYGRSLVNDGFFRSSAPAREKKASSTGLNATLGNPFAYTGYTDGIPNTNLIGSNVSTPLENSAQSGNNILNLKETEDGGVEKTSSDQDWGSILQGSAQVITSIGGVIGLFTGGSTATAGNTTFDQYSEEEFYDEDKKKRGGLWLAILGLVVVGVVIFLIIKYRKRDN